MLNTPGVQYVFAFKGFRGRTAAAKLAYKAKRSIGCDRKQAGRAAFKAFIVQSVTIKEKVINLSTNDELRKSIRELSRKPFARTIKTLEGSDLIAKRGDAQNLDRVIVFRSWAYRDLSHAGHASVAIKSKKARNLIDSSSKTFISKPNLPFSWMPSKYERQQKRPLKMKLLRRKFATAKDNYAWDKQLMTADKTSARLMAGHGRPKSAKRRYRTELTREEQVQVALNPITTPRPRQKQKRGDEIWVTSADKVYVPVFGKAEDKKTNKTHIHMFGLSEEKMRRHIHELQPKMATGEIYYQEKHPKNSCSARALELAEVGGLNHFIKINDYWIWSDPNTFYTVAVRLQERIDDLNAKVDRCHNFAKIIPDRPDKRRYWKKTMSGGDTSEPDIQTLMEKPFNQMNMVEVKAYLKHYAAQTQHSDYDPAIQALLTHIIKKLDDIENQNADLERIIPHSIVLVEDIDKLSGMIKTERQKRDIFLPVNKALQHIHDLYDVDPLESQQPLHQA